MQGINISSNTRGLGGALTNPTVLAKRKGNIAADYPVMFRGTQYPDAEAAFHAHTKGLSFEDQQQICAEIVQAKLRQHPRLVAAIRAQGGVAWLEQCWHRTGARTASFARWEGTGRDSAYLRSLIRAYEILTGDTDRLTALRFQLDETQGKAGGAAIDLERWLVTAQQALAADPPRTAVVAERLDLALASLRGLRKFLGHTG